jgi:arylsulfatase A-like enzyme
MDEAPSMARPNVLFVFADQLRAQATSYGGDSNAKTPCLDALAATATDITHAVSGHPVCCPYRASLLTGQYDTGHGVIINDVPIRQEEGGTTGLGNAFKHAGYQTAYVGKWHAYGSPGGKLERRQSFVPPSERFGFDGYWKAFECTHDYNNSAYYAGADPTLRKWDGYDTIAQTDDMCRYLRDQAATSDHPPFLAVLSWGTPHDPYQTAPEQFRAMFPDGCPIALRPNIPIELAESSTENLRGYYSHIAALDHCMGRLLATLEETGLARDTILVFTSDHVSHDLICSCCSFTESML